MALPSNQDIQPAFDPTGYVSVSGADLLQYLSGATPFADKGLVITTTDDAAGNPNVPDAATTIKWQGYVWRRVSPTTATVAEYLWNPNIASDPALLQWQGVAAAGIGIDSLNGNVLIDDTVTDVKIHDLSYSKLTGVPGGLPPTGAAGGSLAGSYPNPTIGLAVVDTPNIVPGSITHSLLGAQAVQPATDILVSGAFKDMLRVNAGVTGFEQFTPPVIFTSAAVTPTGNALKVPQVNSGGTDFQMVAISSLGRVLQQIVATDNVAATTALTCSSSTAPTTSNCAVSATLAATVTPTSAASTLVVELGMYLCNSGGGANVNALLFQDSGVNALAAGIGINENAGRPTFVKVVYVVASGSLVARTFKGGFSGSGGNTRYNSTDGATKLFGGTLGTSSYIKITEYI